MEKAAGLRTSPTLAAFKFPDLSLTFPNAAVRTPAFGERARTSRIPRSGMRQRRRFAPPPVRASAFRRCTRARGGTGGVRVSESGGMAWRKPRRLRISSMLAAFNSPDLSHTFPNAAVLSPAFSERARTSRIPRSGMRQRRHFAPPPVRASAFRRCTRARGGVGRR